MKNFDAERLAPVEKDRSFRIGGHDFQYRAGVRPEVLARYYDGSPTNDNVETLKIYDETVVAFLEDGYADVWRSVRELEGPEAITLRDIRDLIDWLIEEQTARPTGRSSDSSSGSESRSNGTSSTDDSASREAAASGA